MILLPRRTNHQGIPFLQRKVCNLGYLRSLHMQCKLNRGQVVQMNTLRRSILRLKILLLRLNVKPHILHQRL